jgi:hypothetical protein
MKDEILVYAFVTCIIILIRFFPLLCIIIVADFINALPGNSSVNTAQHATIEEAVFSVSAVTSQQWILIA